MYKMNKNIVQKKPPKKPQNQKKIIKYVKHFKHTYSFSYVLTWNEIRALQYRIK